MPLTRSTAFSCVTRRATVISEPRARQTSESPVIYATFRTATAQAITIERAALDEIRMIHALIIQIQQVWRMK